MLKIERIAIKAKTITTIALFLIENSIIGEVISSSVIGVGLNVNQTEFKSFPRKATSIKLKCGITHEVSKIRDLILERIYNNYRQLDAEKLKKEYLEGLYGYGVPKKFQDSEGPFTGVILGVLPNGGLQLNKNGKLKVYEVKEIVFTD